MSFISPNQSGTKYFSRFFPLLYVFLLDFFMSSVILYVSIKQFEPETHKNGWSPPMFECRDEEETLLL